MEYTLADFLRDGIVPGIRLLTAPRDFSRTVIKSVAVQELPLDGFVHKNDMILSTALGCAENRRAFFELVEGVGLAGAAALVLTFRDHAYDVPKSVIDCAEQYRLPLFVVPWEHPFSDIQLAVINSIRENRISAYRSAQTALFNAFIESASLSDAARLIAGAFSTPVRITNASGRILAETADAADRALDGFSITLGDHVAGYLYLQSARLPSGVEANSAEKHLCFPLSLWFNRKNIEDMVTTRLKNDFVWNLATRNYESLSDMVQQGSRLHFDLTRPYTCIVLKAQPTGEDKKEFSAETAIDGTRIESHLVRSGQETGLGVMVAGRSLDFIIFLENRPPQADAEIDRFIDKTEKSLHQHFPRYRFYWGISETHQKPQPFHELYQNAAVALQYCLTSSNRQYRFTYRDSREAQIISLLAGSEAVHKIAAEVLGPLQEYDAGSGINLLGTLAAYIRCNYNISLAARTLHINRQSLLYRLEKIESLTNMSLGNHKDLFLLEVCLNVSFHMQ